MNMSPNLSLHYISNICFSNIEHITEMFNGFSMREQVSNLFNFFLIEFNIRSIFSYLSSAMFMFICMIIFACIPTKVYKRCIGSDTIFMASFHPRRAWSYKIIKYQNMNCFAIMLPFFTKPDPRISADQPGFKNSLNFFKNYMISATPLSFGHSLPRRLYVSLITNFIPWKIVDWFPYDVHMNIIACCNLRGN